MKNIGIYGGAFNPPHVGHVQVCEAVAPHFDEVWMMPCWTHNHDKHMVPSPYRLGMCRLLVFKAKNVYVSPFEIENEITGGTMVAMEQLRTAFPNCKFTLVVGEDNAATIETWAYHERLRAEFPFVVVPRDTHRGTPATAWYKQPPHKYLADVAVETVSSTLIRSVVQAGLRLDTITRRLLPEEVWRYIDDNLLYTGQP